MTGNKAFAGLVAAQSMSPASARLDGTVPHPSGQPAATRPLPVQRESAPREPEGEEFPVQALAGPGWMRGDHRSCQPSVQRLSGFTVSGLTVTGATPAVGAADTFVAPRGTAVTTTATVVSSTGAALPANAARWSAGRRGANQLERVVSGGGRVVLRVRVGSSSRSVTIHVVNAAAFAGPVLAAALEHRKIGRSNPGSNFGLTVVTIGTQGVRRPEFTVNPFLSGAVWRFGVRRIRHGYKIGVASQGRTDVPSAASVSPARAGRIITDLTPPPAGTPIGPPRSRFWSRRITVAHEQAHVDHFYLPAHVFWPPAMRAFEGVVSGTNVNLNPATANSPSQVLRAQQAAWNTDITARHGGADAAEIGSSETFAHGVSNPMYTALIASIRGSVRPPAPGSLPATAAGAGSITLNWTQDQALTTGFVLERRAGRGPFTVIVPAVPAATRTFTDTGLAAGTRFTYRLVATGTAGRSAAATVTRRAP